MGNFISFQAFEVEGRVDNVSQRRAQKFQKGHGGGTQEGQFCSFLLFQVVQYMIILKKSMNVVHVHVNIASLKMCTCTCNNEFENV